MRAGHVYVISNVGAFGGNMVKIGMTRRLEPLDRVRELGDASVPFRYDVHAMIFSDDAVGLENHLHHRLAAHRVNLVNMRREFFRVSPADVRDILVGQDASIITWVDEPERLEAAERDGPPPAHRSRQQLKHLLPQRNWHRSVPPMAGSRAQVMVRPLGPV